MFKLLALAGVLQTGVEAAGHEFHHIPNKCIGVEFTLTGTEGTPRMKISGQIDAIPPRIEAQVLEDDGKKYTAWIATLNGDTRTVERLNVAREALRKLDGAGVPAVVPISTSPDCIKQVMVMDGEPIESICDAIARGEQNIFKVAADALRILKTLKENKIVHGYINCDNLVLWKTNNENEGDTLKLIDFFRIAPNDQHPLYKSPWRLDPGTMLDYENYPNNFPQQHSFQMQLSPMSYRDDLYNLAELLLRVGGYRKGHDMAVMSLLSSEHDEKRRNKKLIDLKKEEIYFSAWIPIILQNFYNYCLSLERDSVPDYDTWIREFEKAATTKSWIENINLKNLITG